MARKSDRLVAVGRDGIYEQDMRLFIRNIGAVRLVAYGTETSGMYLLSSNNQIQEANAICSMKNPEGRYSKIEMSQADYRALRSLVPKEKYIAEGIIPKEAEGIIKKLIAHNPSSFY